MVADRGIHICPAAGQDGDASLSTVERRARIQCSVAGRESTVGGRGSWVCTERRCRAVQCIGAPPHRHPAACRAPAPAAGRRHQWRADVAGRRHQHQRRADGVRRCQHQCREQTGRGGTNVSVGSRRLQHQYRTDGSNISGGQTGPVIPYDRGPNHRDNNITKAR